MVLSEVATLDARVHNGDTTLRHVIWAINRTIVTLHYMACKMATELVRSLSFTGQVTSVVVKARC